MGSTSALTDGDSLVMTEVSDGDSVTLSFGKAAVGAWDWPAGDSFTGSIVSDDWSEVDIAACGEGEDWTLDSPADVLVLSNVRGVPSTLAKEDSASLDTLSNVGPGVAIGVRGFVWGAVFSVLDGSG